LPWLKVGREEGKGGGRKGRKRRLRVGDIALA
jgi:hypothetical protein